MFDNWNRRSSNSQPGVDIYQIIRDAQTRWLRPVEVIEILRNHHIFRLNPVPPNKPPSGSLFLFDRKTLRFFRKDGHNWRKKKDGKTVREAHERLKAGSVDILHCYYAHGEDNVNFQRRSYWMLEGAYEHIVLVHYREVKEGSRTCVVRTLNDVKDTSIPAAERDSSQSTVFTQSPLSEALPPVQVFSSPETSEVEVTGPYQSIDSVADSALQEPEELDSDNEVEEGLPRVFGAPEEHRSSLLQQLSPQGRDEKAVNFDGTSTSFAFHSGHTPQANAGFSQLPSVDFSNTRYEVSSRPFRGNHESEGQAFNNPLENTNSVELENHSKDTEKISIQTSLPFATLDLSGWNTLLENFRDNGRKQDLKSPCWADMLEQIMTPPTMNNGVNVPALIKAISPMNRDDMSYKPMVLSPAKTEVEAPTNSHVWSGITFDQLLQGGLQDEQFAMMKEMHHFGQSSDLGFPELEQKENHSVEQSQNGELQALQQEQSARFDGRWVSPLGKAIPQSALSHTIEEVSLWKQGLHPLKKLDSFGKWMSHEIGQVGDSSLILGSTDRTYWSSALDGQGPAESTLSFSQQMQMDAGLNPSLAQEQRFSISDFSPDWTFSSGGSKVVIVGTFLERDKGKEFSDYMWACMFGEVEVSAEVIRDGVLRCIAPPHEVGQVPFYITCRDRLACSEIREFEYRRPSSSSLESSLGLSDSNKFISPDNPSNSFLVRFAKMLSKPKEQFSLDQLQSKIDPDVLRKICRLTSTRDMEWAKLDALAKDFTAPSSDLKERVLQMFLKQKLQEWLLSQLMKENADIRVFDDGGQGVLHLVAALGYDWAVAPILAAGIGVNFRDLHGWTALHWASSFGREKVVLTLLAAGAAPGPVTDPTSTYPSGRTPADLAASSGHGGMAGYLAEMSLTTHLSSLALKEKNMNEIETFSVALAEEKAVDYLSERTNLQENLGRGEEQITLQESLRAVRNAARAAALIQATFRRHSFRERQDSLELEVIDDHSMSSQELMMMIAAQKNQKSLPAHRKERLHAAAIQIQCKFRSWKGRKDFLTLRQRVVKIQAHVRGHQVRKKFRKLLWSVGILEKAVLRWRRKGVGLRGFRAELISGSSVQLANSCNGDEDVLRAGRKEKEAAIQKAVTEVQSMFKSDQARAQYRRLAEGYRQATTGEDFDVMGDVSSNHADPTRIKDDIMFEEM